MQIKTQGLDTILVIAERSKNTFHRVSYELLNVAKTLSKRNGMKVAALAIGSENLHAEDLAAYGAETIYCISDVAFKIPEEYLYKMNIVPFIQQLKPAIVLIGATNFGRSLAPRIAAALHTGLTADCTAFDLTEEGNLIQIRPAFSDNIFAHICTNKYPQMATVRYKEFSEAPPDASLPINISMIAPYTVKNPLIKILQEHAASGGEISDAEAVVAVGRGLKCAEDMSIIENLARVLGAHVGVSRALVDAGIGKSDIQIGYSGHRVKPKLYIACGISGAPQHIAGMKESSFIVAINQDPSAPIFSIADIGYVGDLYEVVPRLAAYIEKSM